MAEFESTAERTEPASPKKRQDARERGSVAKSVELNSAAVLVFGLLILYVGGASIAAQLAEVSRAAFGNLASVEISRANVHTLFRESVASYAVTVFPVITGLMLVGLVVSIAQVGPLFTFQPLFPKWSKLNPVSGLKRTMLSSRAVVELVKGIIKVAIVGIVAYSATGEVIADATAIADGDVGGILTFMAQAAVVIALKVGLAFFIVAAADYAYQRYEHEKSLRMTKQEVKDEGKQLEGDPLIKGRIKTIQRQIAYRRMMHDVPKADVVITNPTHYAIAIKYEMGKMNAPRVVAKGVDLVAQRIKQIAIENNVPLVEDKPLAQMLYKSADIGDEIPEKLFQAVAQVLAYVYRLRDNRQPKLSMN